MARSAKSHKVSLVVCTSPGHRKDVMAFLRRNHPAFLEAPFAVRMRQHVPVPDLPPGPSILLMHIFRQLVSVVLSSFFRPVCLTVLTFRQVRASRMRAGTQRFSWHVFLPMNIRKAPVPRGFERSGFRSLIVSTCQDGLQDDLWWSEVAGFPAPPQPTLYCGNLYLNRSSTALSALACSRSIHLLLNASASEMVFHDSE